MAFTTWQALYNQLLDDLAAALAGNGLKTKSYAIGGRDVSYHSLAELREMVTWAKTMAAMEGGRITGRSLVRGRR